MHRAKQAYSEAPPIELLNNLLFYVARAETRGERIDAVRSSFRLGELLPIDESVEQERESLSAPSVRLMRTVAAAIKEDLGRVKDALDLYTRKGGSPEELAPQIDLLKKIGDTLAVLGLGSVREQVQGELSRLSDIITRRAPAEQETLIAIAATLIGVEDGLDDALVRLIMPPGAPAPGGETDPEFRQVTETVLRECIVNLARIKELLGQSLDPTADRSGLDAAPTLARGITAGLLLLGRNRAMEVMRRIGEHVSALLGPGSLSRDDEYIDRLADAIVGIEYYMETLQAGRGDPWYMLDNAERCLASLDQTRASAPVATAASRAVEIKPPSAPAPAARAEPARDATGVRPAVDPELLALFIEEAGEEIATIGRLFPLWAENPSDRESLTRVRRAFHTLKGSGRVVGAHRIGDFAWSVENLLNRIIDGTLERSSGMLATLREAIAIAACPGRRAGWQVRRSRRPRGARRAHRCAGCGSTGRCRRAAGCRCGHARADSCPAETRGRDRDETPRDLAGAAACAVAASGTAGACAAAGRCLARPSRGLCRGRRLFAPGDLSEGGTEPSRGDPRLPASRLARGRHAHRHRRPLPRLPHAARRLPHGRHPPQHPPCGAAAPLAAAHVRSRRAVRRGGTRGARGLAWSASRTCSRPSTRTPVTSRISTGW